MRLLSTLPVSLGLFFAAPGNAAPVNELHQMFADGTVWMTTVNDGPKAMIRLTPDGQGTLSIWPVIQSIKWTAQGNAICLFGGFTRGECFNLKQVATGFVGTFDDGTKLSFRHSQ
jgi:hypothetical protein